MPDKDPTLEQDVRQRLTAGMTPGLVAARRQRYLPLQILMLLALVTSLALSSRTLPQWQVALTALAVVVLAVLTVRGYRRIVAQPGTQPSAAEVAALVSASWRCGTCREVVLPFESECPRCGAISHPGWTLAFGIAFGLGMSLLALWRAGYFD
jgi:hypothetical protein